MKKLLWLAGIAAAFPLGGCTLDQRVPVEMTALEESQPVGSETSLKAEVRLDIGALEVSSEVASRLYSLDLEYDKASYQPDINYEPAAGGQGFLSLKLESSRRGGIRSERHSNRMRLNLTDAIPVSLQVRAGVGDARLTLSRLRLTGLDLESGVGGARISAYEPNPVMCEEIRLRNGVGSLDAIGLGNLNFRRLDFEGGIGGAMLDFSGEWKQDAEISIQVGIGGVTARMPRDIGVRVKAEKHFLSGFQLDGFRREGGDDYYSENYSKSKVRVSVTIKTGVGGFKITWL